jgi:hypothetical protein
VRRVLDEVAAMFAIFTDAARDRGATSALLVLLEEPGAPVTEALADWADRTLERVARIRQALALVEESAPGTPTMLLYTARRAAREMEEAARNVRAVVEQRRDGATRRDRAT